MIKNTLLDHHIGVASRVELVRPIAARDGGFRQSGYGDDQYAFTYVRWRESERFGLAVLSRLESLD